MVILEIKGDEGRSDYFIGVDENTVLELCGIPHRAHREVSQGELEALELSRRLDRGISEINRRETKIVYLGTLTVH